VVARARKIQRFLSQPFHVAEVFTGSPGKYVDVKESIASFQVSTRASSPALRAWIGALRTCSRLAPTLIFSGLCPFPAGLGSSWGRFTFLFHKVILQCFSR